MDDFRKQLEKFLPFLEDLRARLYRGVLLLVAVFVIGFLSAGIILKNLLRFLHFDQVIIATSSPFQFASVAMDIGFFLALIVCFPYMIYTFYKFAAPALTKNEKKMFFKSVPVIIVLFVAGFLYGFFILYYALGILAGINTSLGIANFWNIGQFLAELLVTSALLGLIFEIPLILTLFIKVGMLSPQTLKKNRVVAYFLIIVLVSLLPPTDAISLIAMALPLILLYEGTVILNAKSNKLSTTSQLVSNI